MQISSIFWKKMNCLSINHLPITQIFLSPFSIKEIKKLLSQSAVVNVITGQRWHLWMKTTPCAFLTVSKLSPVTSRGHQGSPALLNTSTGTKGIISRIKFSEQSWQLPVLLCETTWQLDAGFELQSFFFCCWFFFSLIFLREFFNGTLSSCHIKMNWGQQCCWRQDARTSLAHWGTPPKLPVLLKYNRKCVNRPSKHWAVLGDGFSSLLLGAFFLLYTSVKADTV